MLKYQFVVHKKYWEDIALTDKVYQAIYAGITKERFENEFDSIFSNLDNTQNAVLLDLGCGIGRIAKFVAPKVKKYIGVDFAYTMVEKAIEYNKDLSNTEFVCSDNLSIIEKESVDIVLTEQVFIHCTKEQQQKYIEEVYQVLKPGGVFVSAIPKFEHYENGLTYEEFNKLFFNFYNKIILNSIQLHTISIKPPINKFNYEKTQKEK
jgi:ubiquinone/menaquinone biosynthesis C-methylase UbiE